MGKSRLFIVFLWAWLVGVGVGGLFIKVNFVGICMMVFGVVLVLFLYIKVKGVFKEDGFRNFCLWYFVVIFIGILWVGKSDGIKFGHVEMEGVILSDAVESIDKKKFFFENGEEKYLISVGKYEELEFGDRIKLKGEMLKIENGSGYENYLIKEEVSGVITVKSYSKNDISKNELDSVLDYFGREFWKMRRGVKERIETVFLQPVSGIVEGIQLGIKTGISKKILEDFKLTGLSHILSISGFNITILIMVMFQFLKKWSRPRRVFWGIVIIAFFSIFTGFSASVVRAAGMGVLVLLANLVQRMPSVHINLMVSGVLMNLFFPRMMDFDMSFQLSFFATLGLVLFADIFEKKLEKVPSIVRGNLVATLAAQVFTLPILVNSFGGISLISPVANVLILPFIPLIMFLSFIVFLISFISIDFANFLGFSVQIILEILLKVVGVLASIPGGYIGMK